MKRRHFLWLLGVVSGSTVMSACGSPNRSAKFTSYLLPPEEGIVPGEASFRPSTCTECPAGCGVLARMRDGRPVKLEGIPGHPVNDGGLCIRGQSSLYRLYHPERLRGPMAREGGKHRPVSWEEAFSVIASRLTEIRNKHGAESVVFFAGYPKWYRTFLQRLAIGFGSPNFCTESSGALHCLKAANKYAPENR